MRSRPGGSRLRRALKTQQGAVGQGGGLGWIAGDGRILASPVGHWGPPLLAEVMHKAAKSHVPGARGWGAASQHTRESYPPLSPPL